MRKAFLVLILIFSVFSLCACESNTANSEKNDTSGLEGEWTYQGEGQDPINIVTLTINPENKFELTITPDITAEENATSGTAMVSGSYTAEDQELTLTPEEVEDTENILATDVVDKKDIALTYELSADNTSIEISNMDSISSSIPSNITLTKDNQ